MTDRWRDHVFTDAEIHRYHAARQRFEILASVALKVAEEASTAYEVQSAIDALEQAIGKLEKIRDRKP